MNIFKYKHYDKEKLIEKSTGNIAKEIPIEEINNDIQINTDTSSEKVQELKTNIKDIKSNIIKNINQEIITLKPTLDKELIEHITNFEKFIKNRILGSPSYIKKNKDGTYDTSIRLILDVKEFLENESGINAYNFAEEYTEGKTFESYELGMGFSVNSFGAVYQNNDRVLNPNDLSSIPVIDVNFLNKTMNLGFNKQNYGENDLINSVSFKVKYEELGFDDKDLKNGLLFHDQNSKYYTSSPTELDYQTTVKVEFNNSNEKFLSLNDFYNGYTNNYSLSKVVDKLKNSLTNDNYLNAKVITEGNAKKKNWMWLYLLLIIGGGEYGTAPLPNHNKPCATYKKPRRRGIGFGHDEPHRGCDSKIYHTGHNKMYDGISFNGIKTSVLQFLYSALEIFYGLNIKGYSFKVMKVQCRIFPPISLGGEIEAGLCKLQEIISRYIRHQFSVRKYLQLPTLANDGSGYSFVGYEKISLNNYSELQKIICYRINFARIFDFVEKEKLYTASDDESKLTNVIKIYSDTKTYKLIEINKCYKMTLDSAKEMHKKGYHILYNDNKTEDHYYMNLTDSKGTNYDNVSPSNIWTILENSMDEIDGCEIKKLDLELFNGNLYSNSYVYKYSY